MVMRFDGVHHNGVDTVTLAIFRPEFGMCPFLVVVHGFADIVQEAALFGLFNVCPDLGCQYASQFGHFHSVRKLVLPVGCAEF